MLITHLKMLRWPWEVDEKREDPTRKHVPYRDYSLAALSFENLRGKVFYSQPRKKSIYLQVETIRIIRGLMLKIISLGLFSDSWSPSSCRVRWQVHRGECPISNPATSTKAIYFWALEVDEQELQPSSEQLAS